MLGAQQRRHRFHGVIEDLRQQQRFALELDVAHRDARNVEQIVDDARELRGLPLHDFGGALRGHIVQSRGAR